MVPRKMFAVVYLVVLLCFTSVAAEDLEWTSNDGQLQKDVQDEVELPKMYILLELLYKLSNMKNALAHQEPEVMEREKKSRRMLWDGMRGCSFFFWKTWAGC